MKKRTVIIVLIFVVFITIGATIKYMFNQKYPYNTHIKPEDTVIEIYERQEFEKQIGIPLTVTVDRARYYIINGDTAQIVFYKNWNGDERLDKPQEFILRAKKVKQETMLFEPPKDGVLMESVESLDGNFGNTATTVYSRWTYKLTDSSETDAYAMIISKYIVENQTQYTLYAPETTLSTRTMGSLIDDFSIRNFWRIQQKEKEAAKDEE